MGLLIIPTYFKVRKAISIKAFTVPCFSHTNDVWPLKSNKASELIKFGHSSIHMQFCNFPPTPIVTRALDLWASFACPNEQFLSAGRWRPPPPGPHPMHFPEWHICNQLLRLLPSHPSSDRWSHLWSNIKRSYENLPSSPHNLAPTFSTSIHSLSYYQNEIVTKGIVTHQKSTNVRQA